LAYPRSGECVGPTVRNYAKGLARPARQHRRQPWLEHRWQEIGWQAGGAEFCPPTPPAIESCLGLRREMPIGPTHPFPFPARTRSSRRISSRKVLDTSCNASVQRLVAETHESYHAASKPCMQNPAKSS